MVPCSQQGKGQLRAFHTEPLWISFPTIFPLLSSMNLNSSSFSTSQKLVLIPLHLGTCFSFSTWSATTYSQRFSSDVSLPRPPGQINYRLPEQSVYEAPTATLTRQHHTYFFFVLKPLLKPAQRSTSRSGTLPYSFSNPPQIL